MELEKPAGYSLASLLFLFKELGWKNAIIIIYQAIFTHIDLYFMHFFSFYNEVYLVLHFTFRLFGAAA